MSTLNNPVLSQTSPVLEPYRMPQEVNKGQQEASRAWEQLIPRRQEKQESLHLAKRSLLPTAELI